MGAPKDEKTDIAMVVWLIRGGGRNILFDSGFHREAWLKQFPTADYLRPDEAVKLAGVKPEDVTDIVDQPCPLGSHGRHRPLSEGDGLDPEAGVRLLHRRRLAAGRTAWRHRSRGREGPRPTQHRRPPAPRRRRQRGDPSRHSRLTPARATRSHRSTSAWKAIRPSSSPRTTAISTAISPSTRRAPRSARPISPRTSRTRSA